MCGAPSHHYSAPLNFRKGLAAKCSWKCTAIAVMLLSVILLSALIFVAGKRTANPIFPLSPSLWSRPEKETVNSFSLSLCVFHRLERADVVIESSM